MATNPTAKMTITMPTTRYAPGAPAPLPSAAARGAAPTMPVSGAWAERTKKRMPRTPMLPARRAVDCSLRGLVSAVRGSEFEILIGSFLTVMSVGRGAGNGLAPLVPAWQARAAADLSGSDQLLCLSALRLTGGKDETAGEAYALPGSSRPLVTKGPGCSRSQPLKSSGGVADQPAAGRKERGEERAEFRRRGQRQDVRHVLVRPDHHHNTAAVQAAQVEDVGLRVRAVDLLQVGEPERPDLRLEHGRDGVDVDAPVVLLVDDLHVEPGVGVGTLRCHSERRLRGGLQPVGEVGGRRGGAGLGLVCENVDAPASVSLCLVPQLQRVGVADAQHWGGLKALAHREAHGQFLVPGLGHDH